MGKGAVGADLEPAPVLLPVFRLPRTVFPAIERTVAEQTVELLQSLMTGEIFTISVLEISIRISHDFTLSQCRLEKYFWIMRI